MGSSVELESDEQEIYNELKPLYDEIMGEIMKFKYSSDHGAKYLKMRDLAFDLHMALKKRDLEPTHHKYMKENRGCNPDEKEFYNHVHAVEDLFKFLEDIDSNIDPKDITLDVDFKLPYYTRRWGHKEECTLRRNNLGWIITHITNPIQSNKGGDPGLFKVLAQDYVSFPSKISYYLEALWEMAADQGLTKDQVQQGLTDLGQWIIVTEQNSPSGDFWSGY